MDKQDRFTAPGMVEIKLAGHLDPDWSDWFDEMAINNDADGSTRLQGYVQDQPALFGLILKIRDLGLALVSVNQLEVEKDQRPDLPHSSSKTG